MGAINSFTSKAAAKHDLLFNKPKAEALGMTKFITVMAMNSVTLCCAATGLRCSTDVGLLNKNSSLALTLSLA